MFGRRAFLKSGAAAGVAAFCTSAQAAGSPTNASGVGGYDYRLPKF